MLKLIRESATSFVVLTDQPGMSGRGNFEQAIKRLLKLRVPMEEIHVMVGELDKVRAETPKHNVAEFGVGLGDGQPKFIFTKFVDLEERMKGVA